MICFPQACARLEQSCFPFAWFHRKLPHPLHSASILVRINGPSLFTRLGHSCLKDPRKSPWRVTDRHVVTTFAAHVFSFQRRAPTSRSATGFIPGRNQDLPGGLSAHTVRKPASADRIKWTRASFAPRHPYSAEPLTLRHLTFESSPFWTLLSRFGRGRFSLEPP